MSCLGGWCGPLLPPGPGRGPAKLALALHSACVVTQNPVYDSPVFAMRRVRDHLDRHHAEPITLHPLATMAGISRFQLVRCFRAVYGRTPIRYLGERRIARAQDLLRSANLSVTEVCMIVGYT
jgi:transcriptional regulator GlxA family with amidase domain